MSQVDDSSESQNATFEKNPDQTATDAPVDPITTPSAEAMKSDPAPAESVVDRAMAGAVDGDAEGDSEAETLIQSPEKQRTNTDNASVAGSAHITGKKDEDSTAGAAAVEIDNKSRKRKRSLDDARDESTFSTSSRRSSPLSSPRIQPHSADSDSDVSQHIPSEKSKTARVKRETETEEPDEAEEKPVRNQTRRRRPSDILPPVNKHRTKNNGGGAEPGSTERRETRSATYPRHSSNDRSPSPRPPVRREHRRGVSTQLTLGDVERKKRGRPPGINTRRSGSADHRALSASSDNSDSPQQGRSSISKLTSADHDTMSPAKATQQTRKWRDKNGRTFLSRACNNNDLATAKIKLAERPEDLNLADNAGNTPLQIAALEGFVDIVKFLLDNKCDVDTRNIDRETPLIDAVENGHLEVVRLLLQYGANPRLGNAKGDEPYELVPQDDENYEEIRRLLADAKEKQIDRRASSDQIEIPRDGNSSRAASAASPRDSPPVMGPRSPPTLASRRRTGRSESTRNDLLWQANTQENLTRLAGRGDVQGVANILNILQKAETESLIAAAKAGHEEVLQYLLGMGDPEPDPDPIRQLKYGYNTPMLAAIGRGHPEVVKLLVEQSGFNPTRKVLKGKTYHEIAAERKGESWQKEFEVLKTAYDKYASSKNRKMSSPRVTRDSDKMKARSLRRSQSPISSKLRNSSSPTLTHKSLPIKSPQSLQKDKERESGSTDGVDRRKHHSLRRDPGESSVAVSSDQDQTVLAPRKGHIKRRSQSDLPQPPNLDAESTHRRRRLVSGKEHRRRKSIVAEASSDEDMIESRPGTALKRTRESLSPDNITTAGENGNTSKKRRTIEESSPEETRPGGRRNHPQTLTPPRERKGEPSVVTEDVATSQNQAKSEQQTQNIPESMDVDSAETSENAKPAELPEPVTSNNDPQSKSGETTEPVKPEPVEAGPSEAELELRRQEEARIAEEAQKAEEARKVEEARLAEEAKKAEEARLAEEARKAEEARQAEEARKAEEARLAEEARKAEEARRLEEERIAEERRLAEEAERRRKAEEEAALRKKEEEERQERIRKELEERQRRQEEQLRLERLEMERRRREALPMVLNKSALMIDSNDPAVKSRTWLSKFLPVFTVRSVQLDPATPEANKRDLWIPSFQVAGLLVTKDLHLRNYTSFERRPVTVDERKRLWNVSRLKLSYEYEPTALDTPVKMAIQREEEERPKFMNMEELFWVKVCFILRLVQCTVLTSLRQLSDFQDQIFRHPHLANLRITYQPVSLRIIREQSPIEQSSQPSQPNGILPKLTNGTSPHMSPTVFGNGNGGGNGYTR